MIIQTKSVQPQRINQNPKAFRIESITTKIDNMIINLNLADVYKNMICQRNKLIYKTPAKQNLLTKLCFALKQCLKTDMFFH